MGPKYGILAKHVFAWRRCSSWTKQMNSPAFDKSTSNHVQFNRLCSHPFQRQRAAYGSIKSLHLCLPTRTFSFSLCRCKRKSAHPVDEGNVDDENDFIEDTEVEEIFQQQVPTGIGEEDHRVFIVHPDVKWGGKKQYLTTAALQMAEAVGLVNTLQNWTVVDKIILSTKTPEKKRIFGKGNFQTLTEKIRRTPGVTAVFMNIEQLSPLSERELQEAWGVKVFDRYSLVLHIFRRNARTKEAKLQISLAEIPLLRSRLRNEVANLDQQGGGSRYIMGSGETLYEVQQRLLKEREQKICTALERLRKKRHLLHSQRKLRDFPIVAVMGYTNSGKTTLIKALTGDAGLQPKDQLFATLDVTVHAGQLPSYMTVLYVDTIGFLSQLPHKLIDSFSATLEDVAHSDLIIHVRDISHPETVNQKVNVLNILKNLQIPETLMNSIIEVQNKTDLVEGYESSEPGAVPISALHELGLEELKQRVEDAVVKSTGKQTMILKVQLNSPQLGWLYKEATVQEVHDGDDDCTANVKVLISAAAYGRYRKLFQPLSNDQTQHLTEFRLAVVQLHVTKLKVDNLIQARRLVKEAAGQGAKIVVLPECYSGTGYFAEYAEKIPGESTQMLSEAAKQCGIYLVGGSIPEEDGGKFYKTFLVFGPDGKQLVKHRKIHLFDIDVPGKIRFQESETISPGSSLSMFETHEYVLELSRTHCKVGVGICYDMQFAELAQIYARKGCQLLVYPGAFNMTTGPAHWELLQRARAVDNQVYVATASPARNESASYVAWGHSSVVNPWGEVITKAGSEEAIEYADIDLQYLSDVRQRIPITTQRRNDVYTVKSVNES